MMYKKIDSMLYILQFTNFFLLFLINDYAMVINTNLFYLNLFLIQIFFYLQFFVMYKFVIIIILKIFFYDIHYLQQVVHFI